MTLAFLIDCADKYRETTGQYPHEAIISEQDFYDVFATLNTEAQYFARPESPYPIRVTSWPYQASGLVIFGANGSERRVEYLYPYTVSMVKVCECGAHKVGSALHSRWCPLK